MSSLSLPSFDRVPALLQDAEVAHDEIVRLASLARALNPSLPANLRYFQRADSDLKELGKAPGRYVLTNDSRSELTDGLQDTQAVDLFDALKTSLPSHVVQVLHDRLQATMASPSPAGLASQVFVAAHRVGRETLAVTPTNELDRVIAFSPARQPAALAFTADPFLTEVATQHLSRAPLPGQPGTDPAFDFLSNITFVRQALASDASRFSVGRIKDVVERIRSLDVVQGEAPFEDRSHQGWLAFSLLSGGKGWSEPLLSNGQGVVSPHAAYRGVNAITAAVAANDAPAVSSLVNAGALPNSILATVPRIFGERQAEIEAAAGEYMPLAVFGAAVGASEAVAQLAKGGAMLDLTNNRGQTPLSVAAAQQNEPAVRALLFAKADPTLADEDGRRPSQHAQGALQQLLMAHENGTALEGPSRGPRLG